MMLGFWFSCLAARKVASMAKGSAKMVWDSLMSLETVMRFWVSEVFGVAVFVMVLLFYYIDGFCGLGNLL